MNKIVNNFIRPAFTALIGLVLASVFLNPAVYGEDEIITVSGSVVSLDLAANTITIACVDETNTVKTFTMVLSETVEVFDAAGIEDIAAGDDVTVDYLFDEQNNPVAVYLYKFIAEE